jgi:hypothetical protein
MYRRVRSIFRSEGVTNVEWMWSPNYESNPGDPWNGINNYYPGDSEVDWIGLSGFNWHNPGQAWMDFEALYDNVLRDLSCRYAKPIILSEIGTVGDGTDTGKANWISHTYTKLAEYPFVRGIVWFNDFAYGSHSAADFRVTTGGQDCHDYGGCTGVQGLPGSAGQQTTNAYITSVRQSTYTNKLPTLVQATPPYALCSAPSQQFTLQPSSVFVRPGGTVNVRLEGFLYSSSTQITATMPSGIAATASPSVMPPPWGTAIVKLTAAGNLAPGAYQGTIRAGTTSLPITIYYTKVAAYLPNVRR